MSATGGDVRRTLAEAISSQAEAQAAVQKATEALARGRTWLSRAEAAVEADLAHEHERTDQRARAIKAWATGGGSEPSSATVEEDSTARANRVAAAAARAALDDLTAELAEAEKAVGLAAVGVDQAALAVIQAEANELAGELDELQAKRWALRARLEGLGRVWFAIGSQPPRPFVVSNRVLGALADVPPPDHPKPSPTDKASADWRAYHAALKLNADATLE